MNEIIALLAVSLCMAGIGYLLTRLAQTPDQETNDTNTHDSEQRSSASDSALIERVNDKLPQTQCAQCGYPGCRPYAEAIVRNHAPINQCPPGGEALIDELADFLGTSAPPLDPQRGTHKPPQLARIIETDCIGCTLCIAACPVDAIVGAQRYMHTVITDQCTGCELCLPPCPVDCIELYDKGQPLKQWYWSKPDNASGTRLHIPDTVPDTEPQH